MKHPPAHSALRVILVCGGLAAIHSLLASGMAKDSFARVAGTHHRNGLYRLLYAAQSIWCSIWAVRWFRRQPDRQLYEITGPGRWLLRGLQFASPLLLLPSALNVGPVRLLGLRNFAAWLRGRGVTPEPEAQGPVLSRDGELDLRGGFRWIRHPENLSFMILFWAFPRMTVNRLTLALLMTLYGVLGSRHEDLRLRKAYGRPYERYLRSVPMLWPRIGTVQRRKRLQPA